MIFFILGMFSHIIECKNPVFPVNMVVKSQLRSTEIKVGNIAYGTTPKVKLG